MEAAMLDRNPRRAAQLCALAVALAAPAMAQDFDITYPSSRSLNDVATWLQRDTPIQLGQVVDVGPSAITAVTSAAPMGQPRGFLAGISSEAIDPEILGHESIASWNIPVEVDCDRRVVRLGAMTGYKTRDLKTDGKVVREPDTNWVTPVSTAPLGAVVRSLCDRDFKRPFSGKRFATAPTRPAPTHQAPTRLAEAAPPPPALRPALAPAKAAPPPKPEADAAEPDMAKPEVAKADPPKGGGSVAVQIGAAPSKPDIEAMLARFRKAHAADLGGLKTEVATVQSDGKTVNRALIQGFASNAEAGAFCKKLEASGQACFIRR